MISKSGRHLRTRGKQGKDSDSCFEYLEGSGSCLGAPRNVWIIYLVLQLVPERDAIPSESFFNLQFLSVVSSSKLFGFGKFLRLCAVLATVVAKRLPHHYSHTFFF